MPVLIPLITAGVGAASSVAGAVIGGNAKQGIAKSQAEQAQASHDEAMKFAAPTVDELNQIGDRINQQKRYQSIQQASLDRDTKILSSLDPTIIESAKQADSLMKGQEASILAPMRQQQDFQRNQLKQKLAAQLGPGFETSSAGQAALQGFDMQASLQTQQAQMSAFNQVSQFMNYGIQSHNAIGNEERLGFETGSNMSAQTLRSMSGIQQRQLQASQGSAHNLIGTAGSQYAGAAATGAGLQGVGGSLVGMAGTMAGGMLAPKKTGEQVASSQSDASKDEEAMFGAMG